MRIFDVLILHVIHHQILQVKQHNIINVGNRIAIARANNAITIQKGLV